MKVSQRQVTLGLLGLLSCTSLLISLILIIGTVTGVGSFYDPSTTVTTSIACIVIISMLVAYWRGWELARYIVLIAVTLVIGLTTPQQFVTETASITIFIPPALALILATPIWVIGSAALTYLILLIRAEGVGTYADPVTIIITVIIIGGIVLGRLITETAQRNADDQARRAIFNIAIQLPFLACGRAQYTVDVVEVEKRQQCLNLAAVHRAMFEVKPDAIITEVRRIRDERRDKVSEHRHFHRLSGAQFR